MKRVILDIEDKLYPAQSQTNVEFPFELECDMDSLTIEYAYWPKVLSDDDLARRMLHEGMEHCVEPQDRPQFPIHSFLPLVNLVTLSVDDVEGYRGCAHRHDPEQTHVLRAEDSSPGFEDRTVMAGKWKVVINVHAVVTDPCNFKLKVTAEGGEA